MILLSYLVLVSNGAVGTSITDIAGRGPRALCTQKIMCSRRNCLRLASATGIVNSLAGLAIPLNGVAGSDTNFDFDANNKSILVIVHARAPCYTINLSGRAVLTALVQRYILIGRIPAVSGETGVSNG